MLLLFLIIFVEFYGVEVRFFVEVFIDCIFLNVIKNW